MSKHFVLEIGALRCDYSLFPALFIHHHSCQSSYVRSFDQLSHLCQDKEIELSPTHSLFRPDLSYDVLSLPYSQQQRNHYHHHQQDHHHHQHHYFKWFLTTTATIVNDYVDRDDHDDPHDHDDHDHLPRLLPSSQNGSDPSHLPCGGRVTHSPPAQSTYKHTNDNCDCEDKYKHIETQTIMSKKSPTHLQTSKIDDCRDKYKQI